MFNRFPKDTFDVRWTDHVKKKMIFYGLSEQKIRGVIRNFKRKEDGVAPNTLAFMQRNDKPKRKEEIWVMVQEKSNIKNPMPTGRQEISKINNERSRAIIISAWRYPGVSKVRDGVPVPEDVLRELDKFLAN